MYYVVHVANCAVNLSWPSLTKSLNSKPTLNAMDFDVPDDLIAANAVTGEEATRDLPAQDVAFINQLIEVVNDPQVRTHHAAFLFYCVPCLASVHMRRLQRNGQGLRCPRRARQSLEVL